MPNVDSRYVLAFDASCGTCRKISAAVGRLTVGRLEVLPLSDTDVEQWRHEVFGENPPWAPSLFEVGGERVRGWVGAKMGLRLVRRMGIRTTIKVLGQLGDMKKEAEAASGGGDDRRAVGRAQFLRLGAGMVAAGGMILMGKSAASASSAKAQAEVDDWIAVNAERLPAKFEEVVSYSMPYRRAIFNASPPEVKRSLWIEHFRQYRSSRPYLDSRQRAIIDDAISVFSRKSLFVTSGNPAGEDHAKLEQLKAGAIDLLGRNEAGLLLATLGPADSVAVGYCSCSVEDSWCGGYCSSHCCYPNLETCLSTCECCCDFKSSGCGTGWNYMCDGICFD